MIKWMKKNLIYILIAGIIIALSVAFLAVNQIDLIYLIQNPSPEFISAVCIMVITIIYVVVMIIINTKAILWKKKHFGKK